MRPLRPFTAKQIPINSGHWVVVGSNDVVACYVYTKEHPGENEKLEPEEARDMSHDIALTLNNAGGYGQ